MLGLFARRLPGRFARGLENPTCELAGAGYFVAASGASEQRKCAKGSFSSGSASFECTSCEAGKYADEEGLDREIGLSTFMELSHGRFPVRRRQAGSQRFSVPFWSADRRIGPRLAGKKVPGNLF